MGILKQKPPPTTSPKPKPAAGATANVARADGGPSIAAPGGWVLLSEDPVTFVPAGMAKGAGMGFDDGEWVYAGEGGARWFIPAGGTANRTAQQLAKDAFSMRTRAQKRRAGAGRARDFAEKSVATGILAAWGCVGALGQQDVGAVDDIVELWRNY